MTEGRGERATGTPNTIYDLSSVLFHALEGGASYNQYIRDAEEADDQELVDFFRLVRDEDSNRADKARRLIAERTSTVQGTEDIATLTAEGLDSISPRTESSSLSPEVEDLTSTRIGEAPPTTEEALPRTEPISAPPREGSLPPRRMEETPPLGPEPSGDPSGTELMREEVLPSRTEEGSPTAEEVPSGTPPQASPGDVQRSTSPERSSRLGEARSPEEEEAGREEREEVRGLMDKARDYLLGEDRERDYLRGEDRERQDREREK